VAQWIRETGETEVWGGDTFRYKRIGDHKFWTMGSTLAATVVLNRKEWGQDPGDREKVDRWPATPVESTLFEAEPDEKEDRRS
jgi:hypothetical protein